MMNTESLHRLNRLAASTVILAGFLFSAQAVFAREHWPAPTPEARAKMAAFNQHEQELQQKLAPELAAWAAKGKPDIPWAAKPSDLPQAAVPAFPGAEGAGAHTFGGRGGRVYVVTSLADSGPGTLREAVEAAGPRIVVFNVAGIIRLKEPLFIDAPYLTIAGQTAPGDGICVAGESTLVNTHDVVIRYLRFRRGNPDVFDRDDSLGGDPVGNIIVDHCSASWGGDESLSMYRHMYQPPEGKALKLPTVNITIQWCIMSETLNPHNHAFGGTWGGRNTTFTHNLFANNTARNPSIGMTYDFNFINNVLFNWRHRSVDGGDQGSRINCINNYYQPGPVTLDNPVRYRILEPAASWSKKDPVSRWGQAYVAGNYVVGDPAVTADNWDGGVQFQENNALIHDPARLAAVIAAVRVDHPFPMTPVPIELAQAAYQSVLAGAGDTLPRRDPVDLRIVREVRTGKVTYDKGIITDVSQVGGYPDYQGQPRAGVGADGLPLSWKEKYGLDPKDPNLATKDLMGDGYTVMDKYLDGLDPTKKIDWSSPQSEVNTLTADDFAPAQG